MILLWHLLEMTQVVPFREEHSILGKMLKVTLFIQRSDGHSQADDDIIRIFDDESCRDTFRVVFSTPELKKDTIFYASISKATTYISDMLKTLRHDTAPFEYVQVTTSIHPSVLYHVADLDNPEIRYLIEETIDLALRSPIFRSSRRDSE